MKHVLLGVALLFTSAAFCQEVEHLGTEIRGMTEKRMSCEEQVKRLQMEIAALNEKIARAESELEVMKMGAQQKTLPPMPAHGTSAA